MNGYLNEECRGEEYYSDLASERRRADTTIKGVEYRERKCHAGTWEIIRITNSEGAESIGRPMGCYRTLNTKRIDRFDFEDFDEAQNEIAAALCELFAERGVLPQKLLVVGLGNEELSPDAIGPLTASMVKPTLHIMDCDSRMFDALECSGIAVICPSVAAKTGLDSATVIKCVFDEIKPDAVIAIDALAARSRTRLGTTIQLSDTGVCPGTGLGDGRCAIDEELLGVPVVAIGVPTVINSRYFCGGKGDADEFFVAPKDINALVNNAAKVLSGSINQAFGIDFCI